jgi:hypothetical protein
MVSLNKPEINVVMQRTKFFPFFLWSLALALAMWLDRRFGWGPQFRVGILVVWIFSMIFMWLRFEEG